MMLFHGIRELPTQYARARAHHGLHHPIEVSVEITDDNIYNKIYPLLRWLTLILIAYCAGGGAGAGAGSGYECGSGAKAGQYPFSLAHSNALQ